MEVLPRAQQYIREQGRDVQENIKAWYGTIPTSESLKISTVIDTRYIDTLIHIFPQIL